MTSELHPRWYHFQKPNIPLDLTMLPASKSTEDKEKNVCTVCANINISRKYNNKERRLYTYNFVCFLFFFGCASALKFFNKDSEIKNARTTPQKTVKQLSPPTKSFVNIRVLVSKNFYSRSKVQLVELLKVFNLHNLKLYKWKWKARLYLSLDNLKRYSLISEGVKWIVKVWSFLKNMKYLFLVSISKCYVYYWIIITSNIRTSIVVNAYQKKFSLF